MISSLKSTWQTSDEHPRKPRFLDDSPAISSYLLSFLLPFLPLVLLFYLPTCFLFFFFLISPLAGTCFKRARSEVTVKDTFEIVRAKCWRPCALRINPSPLRYESGLYSGRTYLRSRNLGALRVECPRVKCVSLYCAAVAPDSWLAKSAFAVSTLAPRFFARLNVTFDLQHSKTNIIRRDFRRLLTSSPFF